MGGGGGGEESFIARQHRSWQCVERYSKAEMETESSQNEWLTHVTNVRTSYI